ncbi:MAG: carbamoyl-phosphate synthase large subunit [Sphingomonas bacterium]|uniref:carboxyl transferase domain-containing protein n=1 Tax=Sphingomonas bacterium TaxID=1895847 RepID=UPI00260A53E6|nr:carboxyl transferase domain-containing protein [Sphingomonas bacterium]MDB5694600.1 carbamoyl-phosphate synthase large subunit [Sphingomonas bacterium]
MSAICRLLIANRGEIAIRIARAAGEMGVETVAIHSADDGGSLHVRAADQAVALPGTGPAGYLDMAAVIAAARNTGCDAVHPGYGFLSENADFAAACAEAGLVFVGPSPAMLALLGDKLAAKRQAEAAGVPVLAGVETGDPQAAVLLLQSLPAGAAVMVKALAGGGGRGIRHVSDPAALVDAIAACASEAQSAFGSGEVLVERYVASARHIEVQVVADGEGGVVALGERDCTLQRRYQKLVEWAPAPALDEGLRRRIIEAAERLIATVPYRGLATVEFLVDRDRRPDDAQAYAFIEVNPRLQVEHTVTEAVYGVDLVKTALRIAEGMTLAELGLATAPPPRGAAVQLRINAEIVDATGVRPASGTITAFDPPGGPGVRVDAAAFVGFATNPRFDPLIAKLIVHGDDVATVRRRAARALSDLNVAGLETNAGLLAAVLARTDFTDIDTRWFERELPELLAARPEPRHRSVEAETAVERHPPAPPGTRSIVAPLTGAVVSIDVAPGDIVRAGQQVAVLEALKMQHLVVAEVAGFVRGLAAIPGAVVHENSPLLFIEPAELGETSIAEDAAVDLDAPRMDLAELIERTGLTLDENRPDAVARRRRTGQRTARENLDDLFDADSFLEYGQLAIAMGRRGTTEELMRATPGDGIVTGLGTVNADQFGEDAAKCAGLSYDFTVIAGTQGRINHLKTDRLIEVVDRAEIPLVFYCEGGGGRPGDGSAPRGQTGLSGESFAHFAALSGKAPRIGIASGRCFAGNAVFLGCCDLIVATENSNLGLGGPAMIEGGGLGVFTPDEIGPIDVQWSNGVVDFRAADEAEATAVTRTLLGYFQGRLAGGECADQRLLRHVVPENRLRVFDIRQAIELLADTGSWTELRGGFAPGMITGFLRIGGRPMGVIANDCRHLSGAIDAPGCDKAARHMQLCDSFGIPLLSLCDTPGFMVGPEAEATGTVRHGGRMFVVAGGLTVPIFTVVVRKGYGLGAMAMAGGSLHAGAMTVAWPTGEFGGMGLEGAVRLGHRRELDAIADPAAREARYQSLVAELYASGKAVAVAQFIDIDAVIDPADTRRWLSRGLAATPPTRGSRRYIDCW